MFGFNSHPLHARRARAAILSSRWTTREKKTQAPSFQLRTTRILSHPREPNSVQHRVKDIRFGQERFLSSCRGRLSPPGLFPPDGDGQTLSAQLARALSAERSRTLSRCFFLHVSVGGSRSFTAMDRAGESTHEI